jgi:hypothetical protein
MATVSGSTAVKITRLLVAEPHLTPGPRRKRRSHELLDRGGAPGGPPL